MEIEREVVGVQASTAMGDQHAKRMLADDALQFLMPGLGKVGGDVHGDGQWEMKVAIIDQNRHN
jgi:hypothetical protein